MAPVYQVYQSLFGQGFLLLCDGQVRLLTLPGGAADYFWSEVEGRLGLRRAEVTLAADRAAALEVEEYLAGRRRDFDFALDPPGTAFQQSVWRCLRGFPMAPPPVTARLPGGRDGPGRQERWAPLAAPIRSPWLFPATAWSGRAAR